MKQRCHTRRRRSEQGTPLSTSFVAREQVWDGLRAVARPDARFHLRFAEFIPDFDGSAAAIDRLLALPAFASARHVFVTPDNSLVELRRRLLVAGVGLVVSSYNMARGFYGLRPGTVPAGHELYAAWLDGIEHFGQPLSLAELAALGPFDAVVTGASAADWTLAVQTDRHLDALALGHIGAALKHQFIDRDRLLGRMGIGPV